MSVTTKARAKAPDVTRHGLTSSAVLLKDESPEEYEAMRKGIWEDLRPEGALQEELAERAVCCLWRLGRLNRLETEALEELARQALVNNHLVLHDLLETAARKYTRKQYMNWAHVPQTTDEFKANVEQEVAVMREGLVESAGRGLVQDRSAQTMMLLRRYENSLERSFYAAIARIEALQSTKKTCAVGRASVPASQTGASVNGRASVPASQPCEPTQPTQPTRPATPTLTAEQLAVARSTGKIMPALTADDLALLPKSVVRGLRQLGYRPADDDTAPDSGALRITGGRAEARGKPM